MAPKKYIWKNMPKWSLKFRNWKWKEPPPFISKPQFSPTVPNQERRDQIDKSVVWLGLGCSTERETSLDDDPVTTYSLRFPGELGIVPLPRDAMVEEVFDGYKEEKIRLTALCYNTDTAQCPVINFGQMVVEGQKVFLYDLRDGPSLVEGNVNCVGSDAFVLDAKWSENSLLGSLVFDETYSLVGLVYHHVGSPIAIHIGSLNDLLLRFFPQTENMGDFHYKLQQISAALPPLHG